MDRSTFDHSKSGDTNPKGRWRSWLLEPYTRSLPSGREEKSRPPSFCRLRRQTALWYTLDEDQGTEREVRNCPPKRVRSILEYAYLQSGQFSQAAAIVAEAKTVRESDVDPRFPDYYSSAEARYPALFAVETQDWAMAQELKPEGPNWFTQAQSLLAHAIAAGHLHDAQRGKAAAEALEASVAPYPKLRAGSSSAT